MADSSDRPDPDWGAVVGKWTFVATVTLMVLYVAAVVVLVR